MIGKQRFCSPSCASKWRLKQPEYRAKFYTEARSKKLSAYKRKWWKDNLGLAQQMSEWMRGLNSDPKVRAKNVQELRKKFKDPEFRQRLSEIAKERGADWSVRYSEDMGPTKPESVLLEMTKPDGRWNFVVKTQGLLPGIHYYKVDVALPSIKLAIEADGPSHQTTRAEISDPKKTKVLEDLGWKVVRFSNRQILEHSQEVETELRSIISTLKGAISTRSVV